MHKKIWITAMGLSLFVGAIGVAQSRGQQAVVKDEVPQAALLTERGQQLADRLQHLRRAEANMGDKHPSLPDVQQQIEEIKVQLEAWTPAANPFRASNELPIRQIPQMNDEDLRQLVLRLTDDIRLLEQRIERLERR